MRSRTLLLLMGVVLCCGGWTVRGASFTPTQYFISPTGNDSNNGLSAGSPWLTPNHAGLHCGDVISAAAGTYSSSNFSIGKWGTASQCPSVTGLYTVQLLCAGPFVTSCNIADTTQSGGAAMEIGASNWSIIGWAVSSTVASCFSARPNTTANIQFIAFVNVIANGCLGSGVSVAPLNNHGVDQLAIIGAIAYNASQGSSECFSGFSDYDPRNTTNNPGPRKFYAGLFSWKNIDPNPCAGVTPTDGEGLILDNWDNDQTIGIPYTGAAAVEQSLFIGNGNSGLKIFENTAAPITVTGVTTWDDVQDTALSGGGNIGELSIIGSFYVNITNSLFQATVASQNTVTIWALAGYLTDTTTSLTNSYIFGVAGQNWHIDNSGGFALGSGVTQATPNYLSPSVPGAPSCGAFATVTACMASVIANFVPQAGGAAGLGYQSPGPCAPDPLYPIWLKGVVPNGLITKPCGL